MSSPSVDPLQSMAGHSQWAKVQRFKKALDAKHRHIFARFAHEIIVAANMGSGGPSMEDSRVAEEGFEILTEPANFEPVRKKLEGAGFRRESAGTMSLPELTAPPAGANAIAAVNHLADALAEHEDVKDVFSTAEFLAASA
jgi:transcriptional/translational regulatory protein YebC/TACO1